MRKENLRLIKILCELYDVSCCANSFTPKGGGYYNFREKVILLSDHPRQSNKAFMGVFFHELVHHLHFLYPSEDDQYHNIKNLNKRDPIIKRVAHDAEVKVDKIAEEMFRFYFPNTKYPRSMYRTHPRVSKDFLKEHFK